ncbi:MAG: two-component system phosphate regulon sensor histidine kinase PhoR [Myxococcota bacterium]|jgi:two-component system phosphate regulon sensor histidine kinase PhoR
MGAPRRLALLAGGLAGLVLLGDAALVGRALDGAHAEERRQHQVVAERIFDELERELDQLVAREEERSFLEYRYFFVPERQVQRAVSIVRSPISELSDDGIVLGYFQLDPDGTLHNPARPRDNELQFARDNVAFTDSVALDQVDDRLTALTADIDWDARATRPAPEPVAEAVGEERQQAYDETVQSLNRYTRSRPAKEAQRVQSTNSAVANFTNDQNAVDLITQQQEFWDAPPAASAVPLYSVGDEQVDVVISPIRGAVVSGTELVLYRTVRVGMSTYRQGLAVDVPVLAEHIEDIVLSDSNLRDYARLEWALSASPDESKKAGYRFEHSFTVPFDALTATAHLSEIPGAGGTSRRVLLVLSGVLALATVAGAAGLYRAVSAELEFSERRNNFVSAVSHELKTPLTAIRMYSEMLREGIVSSDEKRQEYYVTITAESERLSRLINNVLELSRLEKGNRTMRLTVGAVGPILEQTTAVLRPHVTQSGLRLEIDVEPGLPVVKVDADALSQVLVNLVDNAVKFSAGSGGGVVRLSARRSGSGVEVSVRDDGPGVPSRQLERIFEPFYRGERELTRQTKGTGIGLALVSGLVAGMGGSVQARNHPEGGLEVALLLRA